MQEVLLDEPRTLGEAIREIRRIRQENEFLKRQIEVAQTFQAKMGLTLNKITIEDLFDKKIQEGKARKFSDNHIRSYGYARYYFLEYCKGRSLVYADEVTRDHSYEFQNWFSTTPGLDGKILGEARRTLLYKLIKATFACAEDRNSILRNPFPNVVLPSSPVDDWWTDDYYFSLISAIRKYAKRSNVHRLETITRGIYTTGLRVGLFLGVKHEEVKIDGNRVYIKTKRKVPKSAVIQEIVAEILNIKAKNMFLDYYRPEAKGYILTSSSPVYAADDYRKSLIKVCKKAGMPYKHPQLAKHGFVTKMLLKSYTAEQICKMTGNSTPELINRVYNHIKADNFREEIKADIEDI